MTFDKFIDFVSSEKCMLEHSVSIINTDGEQLYVDSSEYYEYLAFITREIALGINTIKIEQFEKVFYPSDRTAHLFYNPKNGPSFDEHTDPVDVIIHCLDGCKTIEVEGVEHQLKPEEEILIPAGTKHKAINREKALMISYGINDTETHGNIRQDD